MESIAFIVIMVILMIPLYALLIWTYLKPEESFLFGKRWMYKEEPEPSEKVIRYGKFASMMVMIGIPICVFSFTIGIPLLRLVPVVFLLIFLVGAFKIFTDED